MELIIVILVLAIIGALMGWVAGLIWKDNRPIGVRGDYILAVVVTIVVGLVDWYLIPAMGFSDTMKYIGFALEPAGSALLVLWLVRVAKRD